MALILASSSPRRKELLAQALFSITEFSSAESGFDILSPDIDESHLSGETPEVFVTRLAREKAAAGLLLTHQHDEPIVLGADTIVVKDGMILGKPVNEADAFSILKQLSGASHTVITAVAVTDGKRMLSKLVSTEVAFCQLSDSEIQAYILSGEPMDKAGAYGIQAIGGNFVASIKGSYSAVVGLPLVETRELLKVFSVL